MNGRRGTDATGKGTDGETKANMSDETTTLRPNVTLDMRGPSCPGPLLGAKKLVDDLQPGQVLVLLSDCPGTQDDLFAWAKYTGQPHRAAPSGCRTAAMRTTSSRGARGNWSANAVLDLRGAVCPGPIVEAKKLLNGMRAGETLKLVSNCPGIGADVADWVKATGLKLVASEEIGRRASSSELLTSAFPARSRPPVMRVKSHWFKGKRRRARPRSPARRRSSSSASRRIRSKNMRNARFELPAGARYFAFLSEVLVFLTLAADRIAHRRGNEAMAGRVHDGAR